MILLLDLKENSKENKTQLTEAQRKPKRPKTKQVVILIKEKKVSNLKDKA